MAELRIHRVVVLPTHYPDAVAASKFLNDWAVQQAEWLAAQHTMALVHPVEIAQGRSRLVESTHQNIRIVTAYYRHYRKTWLLPYLSALARGVRRVMPELQPECLHAHDLFPSGFAAVLLGMWTRRPTIITVHWGQLQERARASAWMRNLLHFTLRRATRVIAVSQFFANEIQNFEPQARVACVPNVIAPLFFETKSTPRAAGESVELLFVGALRDDHKGLGTLLDALRLFRDAPGTRPFHLTILGEGGARARFEQQAAALGIEASCTFRGYQPLEAVAAAMAQCDVFVVPSRYETFGLVYAEALAAGKPVIACSGSGGQEVVPPWAGAFVPPGDAASTSAALQQVIGKLPQYDRRAISAYAADQFGAPRFVERLSAIYDQAILAPI